VVLAGEFTSAATPRRDSSPSSQGGTFSKSNPGRMSSPVGEADRAMQSVGPILLALARRRNSLVPSHTS
jgi:hypothetical protein